MPDEIALDGLGHAEINHLGHRLAVLQRHQDVRRLEVAVDDSLLVGVLNGLADLNEEGQPLLDAEPCSDRSSR